jgi:hypothetical protein
VTRSLRASAKASFSKACVPVCSTVLPPDQPWLIPIFTQTHCRSQPLRAFSPALKKTGDKGRFAGTMLQRTLASD